MGFVITAYVDDFEGRPRVVKRGQPATKKDARAGWKAASHLPTTLGLRMHQRKRERYGTTELPLMGSVVDPRLGVFRLQPQRLAKVERMAKALLRRLAKNCRWVPFGTLRSFCGTAVSTSLSGPQYFY